MQLRPFKLERYFAQYEFTTCYLLCSSDCESLAIQDLLKLEPEAEAGLKKCWLGYTESPGSLSLRREIVKIYETVTAEEVLVHSGAEEAIYLFMQAALREGDHVIVHWPCYQSLFEVARSLGCQVTLWKGDPEHGWRLSVEELEGILKPETRAIILNTPHNPTGYLMPVEAYREVHRIARANGILLFGDEVYRELEHDPRMLLPAACDCSQTAISLGVMSKTYGLAGLRIGWVATHNAENLQKMAALKDYTTICNAAPSEYLAELALRHRQELAGRNLEIILRNLEILDGFFERQSGHFDWERPVAGPIAFPKYKVGDVEEFCRRLATKAGVLLLPGTLFEDEGNHFRIGFGRKNLPEAVEALENYLMNEEQV
jgi:aspartate/methionine/tyrosine aminotransferase